jgi:pimeloyl-ACP methyl ester carboxylesterase
MKLNLNFIASLAVVCSLVIFPTPTHAQTPAIASRTSDIDGLKLHYLTAGHCPSLILLHGYAETSLMRKPIMPLLAERFTVIAPDLPGIGDSAIPTDGLNMTTAAIRMHALARSLDIGLMVAYAYAARFPTEVENLVVMDASFLALVNGRRFTTIPVSGTSASTARPPKSGARTRAHLLRTLLEQLRRRQDSINPRSRPESLHSGLRAPGPHTRRLGLLRLIHPGIQGFRPVR